MSVLIETSMGDIVIDLLTEERPRCSLNFLKLCKLKMYNFNLFHNIQRNFIIQTGDPEGTGKGGASVYNVLYGKQAKYFECENVPKIKHTNKYTVSMVNDGDGKHGSQFLITTADSLDVLDGVHTVFGHIAEGEEVVDTLNEAFVDDTFKPYQDIRIHHTIVLHDPFDDPKGLPIPERSPSPPPEVLESDRLAVGEEVNRLAGRTTEEVIEYLEEKELKANTQMLEIVGDLPDADMKPPEDVLFVCKLNPVTSSDDLEIIFSRFGPIKSCEVIRDFKTQDSLCYAFVQYEDVKHCEAAYFKMDNVLIDERRIHVDFSQSVSKLYFGRKNKPAKYNENDKNNQNTQRNNPGNKGPVKREEGRRDERREDRRDDRKDEKREERRVDRRDDRSGKERRDERKRDERKSSEKEEPHREKRIKLEEEENRDRRDRREENMEIDGKSGDEREVRKEDKRGKRRDESEEKKRDDSPGKREKSRSRERSQSRERSRSQERPRSKDHKERRSRSKGREEKRRDSENEFKDFEYDEKREEKKERRVSGKIPIPRHTRHITNRETTRARQERMYGGSYDRRGGGGYDRKRDDYHRGRSDRDSYRSRERRDSRERYSSRRESRERVSSRRDSRERRRDSRDRSPEERRRERSPEERRRSPEERSSKRTSEKRDVRSSSSRRKQEKKATPSSSSDSDSEKIRKIKELEREIEKRERMSSPVKKKKKSRKASSSSSSSSSTSDSD